MLLDMSDFGFHDGIVGGYRYSGRVAGLLHYITCVSKQAKMKGYNQTQKSTLSVTPLVHRRNHQATFTSGGYVNQKTLGHTPPSKEIGSHLRIAPAAKYDVKEGFGETGPKVVREFPRLLAPEHLFIPPPEPEVIQMNDAAVQCGPVLFKKELESIQDYQTWLNDTVDPFLKV